MLHTMHDSELIRHYTLDRAGIMFVTDLIKDMLTSLILAQKCHSTRNGRNHYINYINIWQLEKCNYAAAMIWVCYSTFITLLCRCSFSIKYVKYDSMVNKK